MTSHADFMTEAYADRLAEVRKATDDLATVEQARQDAHDRLRQLVSQAVADGVPVSIIARHTGITRQTIHRWERDEKQ